MTRDPPCDQVEANGLPCILCLLPSAHLRQTIAKVDLIDDAHMLCKGTKNSEWVSTIIHQMFL
jgi:hypothetical protein